MTTQLNPADERFCPCPAGRHWGPRGAAGILPYAVARDGQVWVLLSHRSRRRETEPFHHPGLEARRGLDGGQQPD
jgi:hypothetical protein